MAREGYAAQEQIRKLAADKSSSEEELKKRYQELNEKLESSAADADKSYKSLQSTYDKCKDSLAEALRAVYGLYRTHTARSHHCSRMQLNVQYHTLLSFS